MSILIFNGLNRVSPTEAKTEVERGIKKWLHMSNKQSKIILWDFWLKNVIISPRKPRVDDQLFWTFDITDRMPTRRSAWVWTILIFRINESFLELYNSSAVKFMQRKAQLRHWMTKRMCREYSRAVKTHTHVQILKINDKNWKFFKKYRNFFKFLMKKKLELTCESFFIHTIM